jgi:hypothetical protein
MFFQNFIPATRLAASASAIVFVSAFGGGIYQQGTVSAGAAFCYRPNVLSFVGGYNNTRGSNGQSARIRTVVAT